MRVFKIASFILAVFSIVLFSAPLYAADKTIFIRYLLLKNGFSILRILPGFTSGQESPDGGRTYYYDIFTSINDGSPVYLSSLPSKGGGGNDSGYLFHFSPNNSDSYRFQVTGADAKGLKGPSSDWSQPFSLNLTAEEEEKAITMVADPGETVYIQTGQEVILDGSNSYDPSTGTNDGLLYYWQCYNSPEDTTITGLDTANPRFTPGSEGTYYFRLTVAQQVSGGGGEQPGTRSGIRYVQVQAVDDLADILRADTGAPTQIPLGEKIVLDGTSSKPLPENGGKYKWELLNGDQLSTSVVVENSETPVATLTPDTTGTHVFRLTVMNTDSYSFRILPVSVYDGSLVGNLVEPDVSRLKSLHCSIADINTDGAVNGDDLNLVNSSMNTGKGETSFNDLADIDRNLRVTASDLRIVKRCLGKSI